MTKPKYRYLQACRYALGLTERHQSALCTYRRRSQSQAGSTQVIYQLSCRQRRIFLWSSLDNSQCYSSACFIAMLHARLRPAATPHVVYYRPMRGARSLFSSTRLSTRSQRSVSQQLLPVSAVYTVRRPTSFLDFWCFQGRLLWLLKYPGL